MDTTAGSTAFFEEPSYVSCIKVDGAAILPPLMSEAKRAEMRQYRQIAVQREQRSWMTTQIIDSRPITAISSSSDLIPFHCSTPNNEEGEEGESDSIPINLPVSTSTSSSSLPRDGIDEISQEEDESSSSNFASAASSTGTFIIKSSKPFAAEEEYKSEGEVEELEEEPKTILRRPSSASTELIFKRKRPARGYFDEELMPSSDEEPITSSLSKYSEKIFTPTPLLSNLPNSVVSSPMSDCKKTPPKESPTFSLNTNFASAALSTTSPRSVKKGVRRASLKTIASPSPPFHFVLSNEPPLSAFKEKDVDGDSDKENHHDESATTMKGKHVRKLSYTLQTPCAELLAATRKEEEDELSIIESVQNSSATTTPEKVEDDSPEMQTTTARLQQLHLGKGKKAHLERYLDQVNDKGRSSNEVLSRIESAHKKQMDLLALQYKQEVQKIHEAFEKERIKVLEELRNHDDIADPTILADSSNLRNYYISNENPTKSEGEVPTSPADDSSAHENLSATTGGLSIFQNKMQKINPALLKHSVDIRSPLLKGIVFPDPLERSILVTKIPPQVHDSLMIPKFAKLSASVKGYLTRRLLATEKIQILVQTIRDTVELLLKLYEENSPAGIKEEDLGLHNRLIQQLTGACSSFHDIFFKISIKERMAIIANDREKVKAKAAKNVLTRNRLLPSPSKKNMSSATLKSLERRQTQSPTKKDNQPRKSISAGSQSVKPKGVTSYNVSPKRRRMSLWNNERQTKQNRLSTAIVGTGSNTHQRRPSTTVPSKTTNPIPITKTAFSARDNGGEAAWGSETFLVPGDAWTGHPNRRESKNAVNNNSKSSNVSKRSSVSRFSVGGGASAAAASTRASTSRAPWKK